MRYISTLLYLIVIFLDLVSGFGSSFGSVTFSTPSVISASTSSDLIFSGNSRLWKKLMMLIAWQDE